MRHWTLFFCFAAAVAIEASFPAAQEKQPEKPPATDEKTELAEFLADARNYAIKIVKPEAVLKLHELPVLNFTNPERSQERGSVFVWMNEGRPAVMGQFFRHDSRGGSRRPKKHALHSLVQESLEAKFNDTLAWSPDRPGVEWKTFAAAPAPADAHNKRLIQIKQLIQPIKINLIETSDKATELRLIPRPLFEYAAPRAGVLDGTIFSYVVATDPEAILLVEAFDENGKLGFRYAFARFHFRRLTAKLSDKVVWDVEFDPTMMNNPIGNSETIKKIYNSFNP